MRGACCAAPALGALLAAACSLLAAACLPRGRPLPSAALLQQHTPSALAPHLLSPSQPPPAGTSCCRRRWCPTRSRCASMAARCAGAWWRWSPASRASTTSSPRATPRASRRSPTRCRRCAGGVGLGWGGERCGGLLCADELWGRARGQQAPSAPPAPDPACGSTCAAPQPNPSPFYLPLPLPPGARAARGGDRDQGPAQPLGAQRPLRALAQVRAHSCMGRQGAPVWAQLPPTAFAAAPCQLNSCWRRADVWANTPLHTTSACAPPPQPSHLAPGL